MGDEQLDKILKTDALTEAEKITGKSYKEDDATMQLGFLMHMMKGREKKDALKARGDTYSRQPFEEHCALIVGLGFEKVFEEPYADDDGVPELMRAYCHREKGIFFRCYSWNHPLPEDEDKRPTISGSTLSFCLKLNGAENLPVSASWSPFSKLWDTIGPCGAMSLDGREGLLHNLRKIDESDCEYLVPWPETNRTYFTHHYDKPKELRSSDPKDPERREKEKRSDAIGTQATLRRIAQLPRWVRELCPTEPYHLEHVE